MKKRDKRAENRTALRYAAVFFCAVLLLILVGDMKGADSVLFTAGQWFGRCAGAVLCAALLIAAVRSLIKENRTAKEQKTSERISNEPIREKVSANPAHSPAPAAEEKPAARDNVLRYTDCRPIASLDPDGGTQLPYDIRMAMVIARFLGERGFEMKEIVIGGGSTEVSHTGAVAYSASYYSAENFLANAEKNYLQAQSEAAADYGSWFSGLNYSIVRQEFVKGENTVRTDLYIRPEICWEGEEAQKAAQELERHLRAPQE